MDLRGARHLQIRLAVGAAPGERVEVVSVDGATVAVEPGETGMVVSIDDAGARILFDSGTELVVDPFAVRLRPLSRRSA
jgi:hypothetical protein